MTNYKLSEYDRKRQKDLNSANAPFFWIGYALAAIGGMWLLVQFLTWAGR